MAPPFFTTHEIIMLLLILAILSSDCHCHLPYYRHYHGRFVVHTYEKLEARRQKRVIEMIAMEEEVY